MKNIFILRFAGGLLLNLNANTMILRDLILLITTWRPLTLN